MCKILLRTVNVSLSTRISRRAISKTLGLMLTQLAKEFIFLDVTGALISVFREVHPSVLLSVRRTARTPPTLFLYVTF